MPQLFKPLQGVCSFLCSVTQPQSSLCPRLSYVPAASCRGESHQHTCTRSSTRAAHCGAGLRALSARGSRWPSRHACSTNMWPRKHACSASSGGAAVVREDEAAPLSSTAPVPGSSGLEADTDEEEAPDLPEPPILDTRVSVICSTAVGRAHVGIAEHGAFLPMPLLAWRFPTGLISLLHFRRGSRRDATKCHGRK